MISSSYCFMIFQPTPPARTETGFNTVQLLPVNISTHSAREDGDALDGYPREDIGISTHSAREDGDFK